MRSLPLVVCAALLALPVCTPSKAPVRGPLAAVVGGCSGQLSSGHCPFHSRSLNGAALDDAKSSNVTADLFCPCERIRVCKLLALSAFGVTGLTARIQLAVGVLCLVDFLCGIPCVRCLPLPLAGLQGRRWG